MSLLRNAFDKVCRADLKLEVKSFEQKMDEEEDLDALENLTLQSINLGNSLRKACSTAKKWLREWRALRSCRTAPDAINAQDYRIRRAYRKESNAWRVP